MSDSAEALDKPEPFQMILCEPEDGAPHTDKGPTRKQAIDELRRTKSVLSRLQEDNYALEMRAARAEKTADMMCRVVETLNNRVVA